MTTPTDRLTRALEWMRRESPDRRFGEDDAADFLRRFDSAIADNPGADRVREASRVFARLQNERASDGAETGGRPEMSKDLRWALWDVLALAPSFRLGMRPRIEAYGAAAITPMVEWLGQPGLDEFASFVLRTLAKRGHAERIVDEVKVATGRGRVADADRCARLVRAIEGGESRLPWTVEQWREIIEAGRAEAMLPPLTDDELRKLAESLRRARAFAHYENRCWRCGVPVVEGINERCSCRWYTCLCGACVAPWRGDCAVARSRFPSEFADRPNR